MIPPFIASIGAKVIGWVSPWLLAGGLAVSLVGLWVWDQHTIDSLRAEKVAAIERADMASQDASRWFGKAQQLERDVELQNEAAEAARADAAMAEAILRTADDLARQEAADLTAEIAKWKARANENPDQTCTLGPLDRDAVRVLVGP